MKKVYAIVPVLLLIGSGFWFYSSKEPEVQSPYRFVQVERGDLESLVSSTGTLNAVTTVQVGTQVSGTVSEIYVDFNDRVRAGQLVAKIDTTFLAASLRDAEANMERAKAQLSQANQDYKRVEALKDKQFVPETDFIQAEYNLAAAKASFQSAAANLDRARINLNHADIRAPIDGTVIQRNVDVGQTVAASFSAPVLFLIANDLSRMQILANVDESDIGQIRNGLPVRFSVQAYPERSFEGTVSQIRLQPNTIQNVVNYTVVVDVRNEEGLLLPGMTATVDFSISRASDVLKVPNAALRFRPTPEMMEAFRARMEERSRDLPDSVRQRWQNGQPGQNGQNGQSAQNGARAGNAPGGAAGGFAGGFGGGARDRASLWYVDSLGQPAMIRVRTGISDGQMTEVIPAGRGPELKEGTEVISGVNPAAQAAASAAANPFQPQQNRQRGPRAF